MNLFFFYFQQLSGFQILINYCSNLSKSSSIILKKQSHLLMLSMLLRCWLLSFVLEMKPVMLVLDLCMQDSMKLLDDIAALRPTVFCSVPRLYNRIYAGYYSDYAVSLVDCDWYVNWIILSDSSFAQYSEHCKVIWFTKGETF